MPYSNNPERAAFLIGELRGALDGVIQQLTKAEQRDTAMEEKLLKMAIERNEQALQWNADLAELRRRMEELDSQLQDVLGSFTMTSTGPQPPRPMVRAEPHEEHKKRIGWIAAVLTAIATAAGAIFGTGK
ncbi:MAG: hypothetical protein ACRBBM_18225 [Pseudomonadaceae bacterium]